MSTAGIGSPDLPASTKLALQRTRLAYERTLMAWVRTATSLISFGFTIYKFFQYLRQAEKAPEQGLLGPRGFALFMIAIGITALIFATIDHRRNMQGLRADYGAAPHSIAALVASLVAVLGALGFLSVLLRM